MKKLYYNSLDEVREQWLDPDFNVTQERDYIENIVECIREGVDSNKKTVPLFEIHVKGEEHYLVIDAPRSEWYKAIEQCLKFYEEHGTEDECIDTWQLKKDLEIS